MSWILHDQAGQWTDGQSTIDIDLKSSPRIHFSYLGEYVWGMAISPESASSSSGSSTAASSAHAASDLYVRGKDLVAAYAECAPLTYAYQVYFSIVPSLPSTIALELWLSVQTSTLEAHPVLSLSLEGELGECKALATPGVLQLRDNKAGIAIHPLDQSEVTIEGDGQPMPRLKAFGSFMEKGVIRRMRIQLITSQNVLSQEDWHEITSAFSVSPLPLTA